MPSKSNMAIASTAALPIPKKLIDQFVNCPVSAELTHNLDYAPRADKPSAVNKG